MARPFLTARWQDLVIVTWAAPEELLAPRLPMGLELDRWHGRACVSLVAFDFRSCRVKGLAFPGLVNFPEVNLRFYVRERSNGRRGVVFIREFVRSRIVSRVARWAYNEPYRAVPMRSSVVEQGEQVRVTHALELTPTPLRIRAMAARDSWVPPDDSPEHFFKEHSWGYGMNRAGRAIVYEVRHPRWAVRRGASVQVEGDLGQAYGKKWAFLNSEPPLNTMLAVGSAVEVHGHAGLTEGRCPDARPRTSAATPPRGTSPPASGPR